MDLDFGALWWGWGGRQNIIRDDKGGVGSGLVLRLLDEVLMVFCYTKLGAI